MPRTRCCRTSTRWDAETGDCLMKSGFTVVCLSLCWLMPQSWSQVPCHAVVRPDVQINAESISLADLLMAESCPELVAAAARARLGATPFAGSPRVMEGDRVRALLEMTAARDGALNERSLIMDVPQRVTLRASSSVPLRSASRPKPRIGGGALVKSGQRVELLWEQDGIRLRASAVCLEPGAAGDTVRAKFARTGRVVHALVLADGSLRATS
jgi:hypothetical protein